jgi:hypothetical protein
VLGAKVSVKAESHLEFVKRFARDARGENLVQAFERVMVALVTADTFFDGQAGLHGVLQSANTGKGRHGVHSQIGFSRTKVASEVTAIQTGSTELFARRSRSVEEMKLEIGVFERIL